MLLKKIFISITAIVLGLSVFSYFFTVPFVKNITYNHEENASKTILDNVYEIINSKYQDIEDYKQRALDAHKRELHRIIEIVEIIIRNRYSEYKQGLLSEKEAKQKVLDEIRTFRYGNNDYVWVTNYQSVLLSHPDPKVNNTDFSQITDIHGNLIVPHITTKALKDGEGYHSYWWRRLSEKRHIEKLTYSKHFPEWKWVIATGVYLNDVEEEVEKKKNLMVEQLRQILRKIKIAGTGYMFVFDADKNMIIHPDPSLEGNDVSTFTNPDTYQPIVSELAKAAERKDNSFYYLWNKPEDLKNYVYKKISWIKKFDKLGWYIASSVYVDELNITSKVLRTRMIFISILTFLLFIIAAAFLLYKTIRPVKILSQAAQEVMDGNLSVRCHINSNDELGFLSGAFNRMLEKLNSTIKQLDSRVKERTKELVKAKEEAETATRYKSEFLANMSHEIRTPLNAVIGLTHLTKETKLTKKQQDYMNKIEYSSQSLLAIINAILDFSKIEAGKLEITRTEFKLDTILENLSSMFAIKAEEKGLSFLFNVDENVPKNLFGDTFYLTQVLVNLLSNAIKFTNFGSVSLVVEKLKDTKKKEIIDIILKFSVIDTGIGLNNTEQSLLFQPFTQIDGSISRKYGGTGLGLTISKQLAELMGGDIQVESIPSKGSTFSFTAAFGNNDTAQSTDQVVPDFLNDATVLLASDNPFLRNSIAEILMSFSLKIFQASSGIETIDILKQTTSENNCDLLVIDQQMTDLNGIDTIKHIREIQHIKQIPGILLISANEDEKTLNLIKSDSIEKILSKPVIPSHLYDAIISIMRGGDKKPLICTRPDIQVKGIEVVKGKRILLVEDNDINQQVARELLENRGFDVTIKENGKQAVECVKSTKPSFDLILMDIQMPIMNGYQATQAILSIPGNQKTPIIALTAHVMSEEKQKCLNIGMVDYISKPINPTELFSTIIKWLNSKNTYVHEVKRPENKRSLPTSLPGLDITCGLEKVDYDQALYLKLLNTMKEKYENTPAIIRKHIDNNDMDQIEDLIHSLKGATGNLGANSIYEVAVQFYNKIRIEDMEAIEHLFGLFEQKNNEVMTSIDELLKHHRTS